MGTMGLVPPAGFLKGVRAEGRRVSESLADLQLDSEPRTRTGPSAATPRPRSRQTTIPHAERGYEATDEMTFSSTG